MFNHFTRKIKPFLSLSKTKRKQLFYELNNKIQYQRNKYKDNRNFWTPCFIDDTVTYSWVDFKIPHPVRKDIVFFIFLQTAQYYMIETMQDKFREEIDNETTNYAQDEMKFVPHCKPGGGGTVHFEDVKIDKFNNRNRFEEMKYRLESWIKSCAEGQDKFTAKQYYEFAFEGGKSLFVNAVIDSPMMNLDLMNKFVLNFNAWVTQPQIEEQLNIAYSTVGLYPKRKFDNQLVRYDKYEHYARLRFELDDISQDNLCYSLDWGKELNTFSLGVPLED